MRAEATRNLSDGEKSDAQKSAAGFDEMKRNVKKLLDAGVLLAAGTDAPYPGVFQGEAIHHELELLVDAGMTDLHVNVYRFMPRRQSRILLLSLETGYSLRAEVIA